MSDWEPATEVEAAMRDALRVGDQEHYFRLLARTELILPVAADALAGRAPIGWGTWTTDSRTHVLAFTSPQALDACLAEHAGTYRKLPFHELAAAWPELEWWLAVNPGLPIEGYLPAWFVAQISRGDVRLPGRTLGARARIEQATAMRARASGNPPPPAPPVASRPVSPPAPAPILPPAPPPVLPPAPPPVLPPAPPPVSPPAAPPVSPPAPPPVSPAADPAPGRAAGLAGAASPADSFARPGGRDFPRRGDLLSRRGFPRRGSPGDGPPTRSRYLDASESTSEQPDSEQRGPERRGFGQSDFGQSGVEQSSFERSGVEQSGFEQPSFERRGFEQRGVEQSGLERRGFEQRGVEQSGFGQSGPRYGAPPGDGGQAGLSGYPPATGYATPVSSAPLSSAPVSSPPASSPPPAPVSGGFEDVRAPFDSGRSSTFGSGLSPAAGRATPPPPSTPSTGPTGPSLFEMPTAEPISDPAPEPDAEPEPATPDEPEFVPANQVEEGLVDAAGEGSTDRFLSTLLLAKVLVPGPLDDAIANIDQWRTEQIDGHPYVVVFTSTEMLTSHMGEGVPATWIKFTQLIHAWPHETLSFAVNPGTPIGATLPGGQIVALASWADEVGLTDEPTEPAAPATEPEPAERSAPPQQTGPIVMQKTISGQQVPYYLDRGYDRVSGFVHRASEVSHLRTPAELYNALGLSYSDSPFKPDDAEVYVLRWAAHRGNLYRIPYGGQHEAAMHAMQGWVIERSPFRGNGFAPSESRDVIAEFKVDSVRLPHGAELWRVDRDGNEELVAKFDADGPRWERVGEES